jgi:hypothetical protein
LTTLFALKAQSSTTSQKDAAKDKDVTKDKVLFLSIDSGHLAEVQAQVAVCCVLFTIFITTCSTIRRTRMESVTDNLSARLIRIVLIHSEPTILHLAFKQIESSKA